MNDARGMLIRGEQVRSDSSFKVMNPYDGVVFATVSEATPSEIEKALSSAADGARTMEAMSRHERFVILERVSEKIAGRADGLARVIASESGKTLKEARAEVGRAVETFRLSAEEARRLSGEVVPFDGAPTGAGRFGFALRVPLGVVVAITPFNFPLNLAAHKVGPAIAAGNSVVLKPSSYTPVTGLELGKILLESGLPPEAIAVVTGPGGTVGQALVSDPRPRMVTFTGSADVGLAITRKAGLKRLAMELGSNSAVVVTEHCDVEAAAERSVLASCALAGQVCISVQRVLVQESVKERFLGRACAFASGLRAGDQLDERTDVGPMIDEANAKRAQDWIEEAVGAGASVLVGGDRDGSVFSPTIMTDVPETARLWSDEAFAPVMSVRGFGDLDEAIALVNRSRYGLAAGVYTDRMEQGLRAAHEIRCGGVMV
ncbi:MAG: aldehyde dehydrogenase family protein, partial [Candidatus Eisenbacteria bacterium]|nr:aldehyde dehydrogenase family protein [Candidatus Eisenbacteria bacterium]